MSPLGISTELPINGIFRRNSILSFFEDLYKERTKTIHDKMTKKMEFLVGEKVLLYNSRLKMMPGKLHSKWLSLFFGY